MNKESRSAELGVLSLPAGRLAMPVASVTLAVAAITALALLLRLYQLDAASFWSDEAFSGHWIHRSLAYISIDGLVIETTPPLYYILLKGWAMVFGDSDFALRLFSVAASVATVLMVFVLGREFCGTPVALAAALVFAVAPMQIAYAQEARAYALVPLFFAMALLGLLRFIRAALDARPSCDNAALALYATGATLLIYGHATSVFTVAALSGCGGLLLLMQYGRPALRPFVLANLAVALLAVPQLYAILEQAFRYDLDWIETPDLVGLLNLVNNLFVDPVTPLTLFRWSSLLACVTAAALLLALLWTRLNLVTAVLVIGVPAVFLVAVIGLSFWSPFLIPRIIIWLGVPLSLLAGMVLLGPAPAWMRATVGTLLAACVVMGLHGVHVLGVTKKEDWRGLMSAMLPQLAPGDMVGVGPETGMSGMLRYSANVFAADNRQLFVWTPKSRGGELYVHQGIAPLAYVTDAALAEAARDGRRIWLLMRESDWNRNAASVRALDPPPREIDHSYPMLVVLRW